MTLPLPAWSAPPFNFYVSIMCTYERRRHSQVTLEQQPIMSGTGQMRRGEWLILTVSYRFTFTRVRRSFSLASRQASRRARVRSPEKRRHRNTKAGVGQAAPRVPLASVGLSAVVIALSPAGRIAAAGHEFKIFKTR